MINSTGAESRTGRRAPLWKFAQSSCVLLAAASLFAVALPGDAAAASGNVTSVQMVAYGHYRATFSATSTDCVDLGFGNQSCGWYPVAVWEYAGSACNNAAANFIWVGDFSAAVGTQTAVVDFFTPVDNFKICLFVDGPIENRLVFELAVEAMPVIPATQTTIETLAISKAKTETKRRLKARFGERFTTRTEYKVSCRSLSRTRVRCRVSWQHHGLFSGTVTVWGAIDAGGKQILKSRVKVKREQ